jgi:3-deoxy-D-manno-octulosonic-acid transferase
VGETLAAAPLVAEVRRRCPGIEVMMSTTSLTGRQLAYSKVNAVTLLPIDALRVIDRALRRVKPRCIVLIETEIWPGLLRAARRQRIPVVLASGRVSARAFQGYRKVAPLLREALAGVAAFGMQTVDDAERIVTLGAPSDRVTITGSLKASTPGGIAEPPNLAGLERRKMLIAASTQPGEESFVLEACAPLWKAHPECLLLIAPRRPERFDEVEALVARTGLRYQRRSRMTAVDEQTQVMILDTLGELTGFHPSALAVFVGGTVAPLGGHNVLEPAAHRKAVAFGPHTENVAEAARALCEAGGATVIREPAELANLWMRFLDQPEEAAAVGERARGVVHHRSDALERTWALLAPHLVSTS